jgi:predicted ester cyclase
MAPDELKTPARRVVEEILNQAGLAVTNELISPGCVHHIPGGQPVPGLTALRDWLTLTLSILPDFHAMVEDEIAGEDRAVQRLSCYGTHEGEFCGVRPAGRQVSFQLIQISRARRFTEHWSSADLPGVLRHLTAPPPLPPDSTADG